ncbi:hypothetical protein GCM10010193_44280 [Kitasatospora atroaurantiaca]|uniref:Uncharacterized protein n=1 Tax=Kitasatospora atroaurantiaca TaxID=285545 RepID=A0A561EI66_9ACTN|nr:hypothetical protein FB465_0155 [Kitasatospora atroaurantiaca]
MSDNWTSIRSRWESIRQAVDGTLPSPGMGAALGAGRLGLSVNPVAITGEPGAGKSVLYDALTQAIRTGDRDSRRSPDSEKHRTAFRSGSRRSQASVVVIPGQASEERERALAATMGGTASPHGIIHVVCWGHNRTWQRSGQRDIEEALRREHPDVDRESVRAWHLRKEADDFRDLCERIIEKRAAKRLRWMIVAVSKCDLYWDRIDQARDHYIPGETGNESEFCTQLRDLADETSIDIAVLPMSSRLIRHQFLPGLPTQLFQLDDEQLGVLRTYFSDSLQGFLAARDRGAPNGGH